MTDLDPSNKSNVKNTKTKVNYTVKRKLADSDDDDNTSSENEERDVMLQDISESEPELECEIWDLDTISIPKHKRNNAIIGYNLGRGLHPVNYPEKESDCSKQLNIKLNDTLVKENFKMTFKEKWNKDMNFDLDGIEFLNNPFKFCCIDNFIGNVVVLDKIRSEMNDIEWNRRSMDLYEFFQSSDLKHVDSFYITKIYQFIDTEIREWMSEITGIELVQTSATCSFYSDTDYLLVHDDLQENRAIAFVLYMTDPLFKTAGELWKPEMGGALELLNKDEFGHPNKCVKKIQPKNNRFIFFKVTNASYHQVEEVLNMDHCRLSINGWFHTKELNTFVAPKLDPPSTGLFSNNFLKPIDHKVLLSNWISSDYLHKTTRIEVQKQIENESEISLHNFFKKEKYENLYEALQNLDIMWEWAGPPNRRRYETIKLDNIPLIVQEFLKLFQSKDMFALLKDYTDLDLIENDIMHPTLRIELQRWTPGCYSLLSEYSWENEKELDVIMYLGCQSSIVGGQTMYLASDEKIEDALITLETVDNSLNIVFRDTCKVVSCENKIYRPNC